METPRTSRPGRPRNEGESRPRRAQQAEHREAPRGLRVLSVVLGIALALGALSALYAAVSYFPGSPLANREVTSSVSVSTLAAQEFAPGSVTTTTTAAAPDFFGGLAAPSLSQLPEGVTFDNASLAGTTTAGNAVLLARWFVTLVSFGLVLYGLWLVNRYVADLMKGSVTHFWNVKLIRRLSLVSLLTFFASIAIAVVQFLVIRDSDLRPYVGLTSALFDNVDLTSLGFAVGFWVLALILEQGRALQRDVEATI